MPKQKIYLLYYQNVLEKICSTKKKAIEYGEEIAPMDPMYDDMEGTLGAVFTVKTWEVDGKELDKQHFEIEWDAPEGHYED